MGVGGGTDCSLEFLLKSFSTKIRKTEGNAYSICMPRAILMYFTAIVRVQYRADICEIFKMINIMTQEDIPALINLKNV